jgi:hypothetical protein
MKGWQPVEILKQMCAIYASICVVVKMGTQQTIYKQRPAQAYTVSKVENNAWVKNVLWQTLESFFPGNGTEYECQYCACDHTGSWIVGHRNMCSQWVAHVLTGTHKEFSMSLLMEYLQWYHTDSDVFLQWTVVCHEIWCHHFAPTQACNEDTLLHLDVKNSYDKDLLVQWCWLWTAYSLRMI